MNRRMAARPKDVSVCTFLSVLTARSERQVKVKGVGLREASTERSDESEQEPGIFPFFPSDDTSYRP